MKTKITLTILVIVFALSAKAQWVATNNGLNYYVWGSAVYNGELYACGNFDQADGNPALAIARWNGSAWSDVGGGFQQGTISYAVRSLIEFNGELVAGGYVDSVAGMPIRKVAKWNGTTWSAMGMDCPISTVSCFAIHNGELYAGGQGGGAVKVCVAKWTGSNWLPLDTQAGNTDVWALASYNGQLYAGGSYSNFNGTGAAGIVRWNGSSWSGVGTGFGLFDAVRTFGVFNSQLYIGGAFDTIGGVPANNIVSWNGSNYSALQGGVNTQVQSLFPHGSKLFVGGTFWMVNSTTTNANRAAHWDGSAWTVLGMDLAAGAKTICIYNNELYYGGEGAGHNYMARWTGGTFPIGINENESDVRVSVYPNPASDKLAISIPMHREQMAIKEIKVFDVLGSNVISQMPTANNQQQITIDVSDLTPGIYFLTCNGSEARTKFVVQR